MRGDELQGEAATLYEEWRQCGCTEAEALDLVERSGLLGGRPYERQVYEASPAVFRSSPRVASIAALGGGDAQLPAVRGSERNSQGRSIWMGGTSIRRSFVGRGVRGE